MGCIWPFVLYDTITEAATTNTQLESGDYHD